MTRSFIELPLFTKRWSEIGLTDSDLFKLQEYLLNNPESGSVMEGTGGIRKIRFGTGQRGKSGSVRICYIDFSEYGVVYFITAYLKSEKESLTNKEKAHLKKMTKALKDAVSKRRAK